MKNHDPTCKNHSMRGLKMRSREMKMSKKIMMVKGQMRKSLIS
jgi:hypothetical protein